MVRVLEITGLESDGAEHGGLCRRIGNLVGIEGVENRLESLSRRLTFVGVGRTCAGSRLGCDALETLSSETIARSQRRS